MTALELMCLLYPMSEGECRKLEVFMTAQKAWRKEVSELLATEVEYEKPGETP